MAPACGCGFVNSRNDRYCGGCGSKVARLDWPSSPPPSFFAPDTVRERKRTEEPKTDRGEHSHNEASTEADRVSRSYNEQTMPIEILDEIQ